MVTKKTEAKEAKACKVAVSDLSDPRWWQLPEVHKGLFRKLGPSTSLDLTKVLEGGKRRCVRRRANSNQCEEVSAEFWQSHRFFENSPYFDGLGIYDPAVTTVFDPQTHLDAREFYVLHPEKVWPVLVPDARRAKPRRARKRSTRKALQRAGTGSAIKAGNSADASGATEARDTAAVAGPLKRKRRGKLTAEQIKRGRAHLCAHRELKWKRACPELRRVMKSDVSDNTLWRYFFRKS